MFFVSENPKVDVIDDGLKDLTETGLFFLSDKYFPVPPKSLRTFIDFLVEYINYRTVKTNCNISFTNLIPYMYYFWKKDGDNIRYSFGKYTKQAILTFLYRINQMQQYYQLGCVTIDVFDSTYLKLYLEKMTFPDGTLAIDFYNGIKAFQKIFLKIIDEAMTENFFKFPAFRIFIYKENNIVDKEFGDWLMNCTKVIV